MELFIGGQWTAAQSGRVEEVTSPFHGVAAGSVPMAGIADADAALTAAVAGAKVWRNTRTHWARRWEWERPFNFGGGSLIDNDAPFQALVIRRIADIGLDVFDPEAPQHHPLFDHPDVVLTPT